MPTIPSSPSSFTITVPVGTSSNDQAVTFAIPAGTWNTGAWQTIGTVTSGHLPIQHASMPGGIGADPITPNRTDGSYTGNGSVAPGNMTVINAAAGGTLDVTLTDQRGVTPDVDLVDVVSSFVLILSGGSSGSSSTGASSSSGTSGNSGSSGGGCVTAGTTGSVPMAYDSTDPIYADSAGYWVVFDDTVKVVADIDTPNGWSMNFDDPTNPSTAFVGVEPLAVSGNYYINYYFSLPSSSSSSSSLTSVTSSSSSGSNANGNVAAFVSNFCVTGVSSSSNSLASGSSSLSSAGSASGQPSASSSSGGAAPCKAYKDDYFNVPFDKHYSYSADQAMFNGTNDVTERTYKTPRGKYKATVTPGKPIGVCIPSHLDFCADQPDTSWTNFQDVLKHYASPALPLPPENVRFTNWEFNFVGIDTPLPDGSLRCHTYEANFGYTKSKELRFGIRFHIEYCPGSTPPPGTPTEDLHWIQVIYSSYDLGDVECILFLGKPTTVKNKTDVSIGTPYFTNDKSTGFTVVNPCESKGDRKETIGVFLVDHPQNVEIVEGKGYPRIFRAETFLCKEIRTNPDGSKVVNVYNGVQWGFRVEIVP
ncbi:MAG: hypothetical protein JWL77_1063 [Chthonomonadaceae bacterium]|nr:hypothetical protein [Chthonomonadaceae bacterium]